ncbi:MAG: DUF1343 domain-containing protein [Flavobacteriales bacterium]|jgi:uncharacterized protein YbbC (DUF1343 family)|nr:DUF1343 domain-containing protein [Flavobacteriales bacterium]
MWKFLFLVLIISSCSGQNQKNVEPQPEKTIAQEEAKAIIVGAAQLDDLFRKVGNKKIVIVANQTSATTVDFLHSNGRDIAFIYAPEHGFRGKHDAGEKVKKGVDSQTGLTIKSLYGKNKKPKAEDLKGIDLVVFDIQDVGARFYTYISTLHYVMEACAEQNIPVLVLDRPNPNGHYIDGPILEKEHQSFVGMHPVPVVHGMTMAEYAQMINGEKWLKDGIQCELDFILCENYDHQAAYVLPIKPSPNLPNQQSIYLYPSLCFFEGTPVSVGRGTEMPFQIFGHPEWKESFSFQPMSREGAKYPKHENKLCKGFDLRQNEKLNALNLDWLITAYQKHGRKDFFKPFFHKLAGTKILSQQIMEGKTASEIKKSWEKDLKTYKTKRKKYLLYN